jgi:hypothetical protein
VHLVKTCVSDKGSEYRKVKIRGNYTIPFGAAFHARPPRISRLRQQTAHVPALVGIGRVGQGRIEQGGLSQDGAVMAEGIEAELTVVGPHAAVTDAAEGKAGIQQLHDRVVNASAAQGGG